MMLNAAPALAQDTKGLHGFLDLGAAALPDYEGSADYQAAPMFAGKIAYDEYYLELMGPTLRANVMPAHVLPFGLELGPAVGYRFGRSSVQNDQVDAMRNIDGDVAAGGFTKFYTHGLLQDDDELGFDVEALSGLGTGGTGTTVSFGPSYSFSPIERVHLGFNLSATWASDGYNQTYFGVSAADARRSGFSTYDAGAGLKDVGLSVNAIYQLTEHWGITGMAGITRLVGSAADSPLVKDAGNAAQGIVSVGIAYRF